MSTTGVYGFIKGNISKVTYNHWDSYPEDLGKKIVDFIRATPIKEMNEIFYRIIMIDQYLLPTEEQRIECTNFSEINEEWKENNWYWLLHKTQGELSAYKNGLVYMIDNRDQLESVDWVYSIDLDNNVLEIFHYSQNFTFPLDNIPENWIERIK